jgi:hypothetical protein
VFPGLDAYSGRVVLLGFTGGDDQGGEDYPERLRTTLERLAEFNRDIDAFGEVIARKGRRLS